MQRRLERIGPVLVDNRQTKKFQMNKMDRIALERIRQQLIQTHDPAAWHIAATIIKGARIEGGMDKPKYVGLMMCRGTQ